MVSINTPYKLVRCFGGKQDQILRMMTFHFGHRYPGPYRHHLVIANQEPGGAYSQSLGIWFPGSRLTKDGNGMLVGDLFKTEKPREY